MQQISEEFKKTIGIKQLSYKKIQLEYLLPIKNSHGHIIDFINYKSILVNSKYIPKEYLHRIAYGWVKDAYVQNKTNSKLRRKVSQKLGIKQKYIEFRYNQYSENIPNIITEVSIVDNTACKKYIRNKNLNLLLG